MFDNGMKSFEDREKGICPYCGSVDSKLMGEKACHFGQPHEGHDGISSRSDKYWENAERNRLKRMNKQIADEQERMQYDVKHREKVLLGQQRMTTSD